MNAVTIQNNLSGALASLLENSKKVNKEVEAGYVPYEDSQSNNCFTDTTCPVTLPSRIIACLCGKRRDPEDSEQNIHNRQGHRVCEFSRARKTRSHCQVYQGRYRQEALYQPPVSFADSIDRVVDTNPGGLQDQNTTQLCHRYFSPY